MPENAGEKRESGVWPSRVEGLFKHRGDDVRTKLAFTVTWFSILIVGLIAIAILIASVFSKELRGAQLVLTGVLPLLGTWVGTILAYYFSKENFEAAAESERKRLYLEKGGPGSIPALNVARKPARMVFARMPESNVVLAPGKDLFSKEKITRLPVFDDQNCPKYVIHQATVLRFREEAQLEPHELQELTLEILGQKEPELLEFFRESFATVGRESSLIDAKRVLDKIPHCRDVFITEDGTRNSPVLGWLTNTRIMEQLD